VGIVYYNNADYEQFLFSSKEQYQFQFNRTNLEFEYFILITQSEPLYSKTKFSKNYSDFIQETFQKEFLVKESIKKSDELRAWSMNEQVGFEIASKKTAHKLNQELFHYDDIKLIKEGEQLKDNTFYILDGELSGRGHFLYPKDKIKIEKMLSQGIELIAEPKRERTRDISTLFMSVDEFVVYENFVDEHCQYKGSIISDLSLEPWYEEYVLDAKRVHQKYQKLGIEYPFSIDSYFYLENEELKIKVLSEVNARKSMGWMANWLHKFFKSKYSLFFISRENLKESALLKLNPEGKMFNCYFAHSSNYSDINNLRDKYLAC